MITKKKIEYCRNLNRRKGDVMQIYSRTFVLTGVLRCTVSRLDHNNM